MKTILICFAGRIASGKTTLSQAVAQTFKWPRASFGDRVRIEARRKGFNESREVLQKIGEALIEEPDDFCNMLLEHVAWKPGRHLVIDGLRHTTVLNSLRRLTTPSEVLLVLVETGEQTLEKRLAKRGVLEGYQLSDLEAHSTEREVLEAFPDMADLIVDGTLPVKTLVGEIVAWVQNKIEVASITYNGGRP